MRVSIALGLATGNWDEAITYVVEAERLGVDSIWSAEAWGYDAVTPLAYLAAKTSRIRLGSGIMQAGTRTPALVAMTAMSLASLSADRFLLGLGPEPSSTRVYLLAGLADLPPINITADEQIALGREALEVAKAVDDPRTVIRAHQALITAIGGPEYLNERIELAQELIRLGAEDSPQKRKLEAVLYEFAGAPRSMAASDLTSRIEKAGVDESDIGFYIDLLCDINFIGIQTTAGFKFSSDEDERRSLRKVSEKLAAQSGQGEEAYEINPAFYQVLQIE